MAIYEIEVANKDCANLSFNPFAKVVRGRYEVANVQGKDPGAANIVLTKYSSNGIIPGQIIGYDTDKKIGYVREPLWEEKEILNKITRASFKLDDPIEVFPSDQDTVLYWMHRAVLSNDARVTKGGTLEKTYDEKKARKTFFVRIHEGANQGELKELREVLASQQEQIAKTQEQMATQQAQIGELIALLKKQK